MATTHINKLLDTAKESWASKMLNSTKGKQFLEARNIDLRRLNVGYESKGIQSELTDNEKALAEEIGLLTRYQNKLSSPFKESVVFPLYNQEGRLVNFSGHKVNKEGGYVMNEKGFFPHVPKNKPTLLLTLGVLEAAYITQFGSLENEADVLSLRVKELCPEHVINHLDRLLLTERFVVIYTADQAMTFELIKEKLSKGKAQRSIEGLEVADVFKASENELLSLLQGKEAHSVNETQTIHLVTNETTSSGYFDSTKPEKLRYVTDQLTYTFLGQLPIAPSTLKGIVEVQNNTYRKLNHTAEVELLLDKDREKLAHTLSGKLAVGEEEVISHLASFKFHLTDFRERKPLGASKTEKILTEERIEEVTSILSSPNPIQTLEGLMKQTGLIGQSSATKLTFLTGMSYKQRKPSHAILLGDSSSGKTTLMNGIAELMPKGRNLAYTKVTGASFYNSSKEEFHQKVLTIEDRCSLDSDAKYLLRELQSKGELSVKKNERDTFGNYSAVDKKVKAQMSSLCCSTSGDIQEDDQNRTYLIQIDSSEEQTTQILEYQNRKARGEINNEKEEEAKDLIRDIVSHLDSYEVINPHAGNVLLPKKLRAKRRFNQLFLQLTELVALFHQKQRKLTEDGKLIAQLEDVRIAIELLIDTIAVKSDPIDDSLLREFFENLKGHIQRVAKGDKANYSFRTKELINELGYGKTKVCQYIKQLHELEYVQIVDGSKHRGFIYQISEWDHYTQFKKEIKNDLLRQVA